MFYNEFAKYYDIVQEEKAHYDEEIQQMDTLFKDYQVETVLDLACGTGAHLLGLAQAGYHCSGRDISPAMLAVANEKSIRLGLNIDWQEGDMRYYKSNPAFDAVLGLYSFTSLVSDEDFLDGLSSARKAVREGGLFYFNLLNADCGAANSGAPFFFIDAMVNRPGLRMVRLNQVQMEKNIQDWKHIYLVDENQSVRSFIGHHRLRFHHLDQVREKLSWTGFEIINVAYANVQGYKNWDMFILAQASSNKEGLS